MRLVSLLVCILTFHPTALLADEKPAIMVGGRFEVEATLNIPYYEGQDADAKKHKLNLYVPKGHKDYPVLFFIHGGAWTTGDRAMYGSVGQVFAKNGIGTVVISYRLSPKIQHPEHIRDVARAFAWTHKNIGKYGGKPDRIFVTGQSAGGHLAALLATNETYLHAENLTLKDIKGVLPISGIYTFAPGRMKRVIGEGVEAATSASPIKHVHGKEPPFLILYAENDFPKCDLMSKDLCKVLHDQKVAAEVKEIADRNHITIMLYSMLSEADPTTQAMLEFIAKHSNLKLEPRDSKSEN
ncbi:MAG: alpha/beta hydrolase [Planctomycetes bacterium]|nr:alpha/beta hydrolase [Planctomycetota bacterium]